MQDFFTDGQPFDFDDIANQLLAEGAERSPAYVHGGICGIFAGAGPVVAEDCLAATAQALDLGLHGELAETCLRLADVTRRSLEDDEFDFQPLLPDDDAEMAARVGALADWCRGFLAAYALVVADTDGGGLGEETSEILKDMAAIADAGPGPGADEEYAEDAEDDENHFFEIVEYLRFATLNLFMNQLLERQARDGEPGQ